MSRNFVGYLFAQNQHFKSKFSLYQGINSIGRNPTKNQITFQEHSVSSTHCILICQNNQIYVIDLNSKNGVYLNSFENHIPAHKKVLIDPKTQVIYISQIKCSFDMVSEATNAQNLNKKTKIENYIQSSCQQKLNKNFNRVQNITKKYQQQIRQSLAEHKETQEYKSNINELRKSTQLKKQKSSQGQQQQSEKQQQDSPRKQQNDDTQQQDKQQKNQSQNDQITYIDEGKQQQDRNKKLEQEDKRKVSKNKKQPKVPQKNQQTKQSKKSKQKNHTKPKNKVSKPKDIQFSYALDEDQSNLSSKKLVNRKLRPRQTTYQQIASKNKFPSKKVLLTTFRPNFKVFNRIKIVESVEDDYEILVIGQFLRTFKLLHAICKGVPIVTNEWLLNCQFFKQIVRPGSFQIKLYGSIIKKSLDRVRSGVKIFKQYKFHFSGNFKSLQIEQQSTLIKMCGGQVIKNLRKGSEKDPNVIIILPKNATQKQISNKSAFKDRIYTNEFILDSCFKQQIDWNSNKIQI